MPVQFQNEKRAVVVFAFPRIGDFIMCNPLIQLIRGRFPDTPIDIVARRPGIEMAPFMQDVRTGLIDDTLTGHFSFGKRWRLARKIRAGNYAACYVVSRSYKVALIPFLAGVPERIGWMGEARFPIINRPRFGEARFTTTVSKASAIGLMRGEPPPLEWPAPRLAIPVRIMENWRMRYQNHTQGPTLALAPGASTFSKIWPTERFAELARRVVAMGWRVRVIGEPREAGLAELIRNAAPTGTDIMISEPAKPGETALGGEGSVSDLVCAIGDADAFIGNDSGPLHIAAALGKPCIGVFGPTDCRPINKQVQIVMSETTATAWPDVELVMQRLKHCLDNFARPVHTIRNN